MRVSGLRPALAAIAGIGVLLTGIAVALCLTGNHVSSRGVAAGITFAVMAGYIGTGLFAWSRRPANPTIGSRPAARAGARIRGRGNDASWCEEAEIQIRPGPFDPRHSRRAGSERAGARCVSGQ